MRPTTRDESRFESITLGFYQDSCCISKVCSQLCAGQKPLAKPTEETGGKHAEHHETMHALKRGVSETRNRLRPTGR